MCDGPEAIRIVRCDALDNFRACQRGNCFSGDVHKRRDLLAHGVKDDEATRKREYRRIIEPPARSVRVVVGKLAGPGDPNIMNCHLDPPFTLAP
jgi:hypothetical protein